MVLGVGYVELVLGEGCLGFLTVGELEDAEPVFVVKRVEFHKKIKFTLILGQIGMLYKVCLQS